jgi:hypothetical protein
MLLSSLFHLYLNKPPSSRSVSPNHPYMPSVINLQISTTNAVAAENEGIA